MTGAPTLRSQAKADRRTALLDAAAALFARSGFNGVAIEDLGAAVGISGPAVYRHFSGKQAVLSALLVGVSEGLASGGQMVVDAAADDRAALLALVRFHVDFALTHPDVIRVQDRDLDTLTEPGRHQVRALQRSYVELWVAVLGRLNPTVPAPLLRVRAQATFGLINSTPHSVPTVSSALVRPLLEEMALAALTPAPTPNSTSGSQ
ncbi:TetR family transcriptional regulator BkaR [Leifsonia kafniensis]|uniref:TetR family transcriptional regulator BkaR n=1 Tax=Leifsonia kafniensis TaxID=475957 RepID=A0ABP7L4V9_9MICO